MNLSQKNRSKMSPFKCFGVDLSPDNMAVAIVYFVQGVLGLSRLAVSFYLKDDLNLDPAEVFHIFLYFVYRHIIYINFHYVRDFVPNIKLI